MPSPHSHFNGKYIFSFQCPVHIPISIPSPHSHFIAQSIFPFHCPVHILFCIKISGTGSNGQASRLWHGQGRGREGLLPDCGECSVAGKMDGSRIPAVRLLHFGFRCLVSGINPKTYSAQLVHHSCMVDSLCLQGVTIKVACIIGLNNK